MDVYFGLGDYAKANYYLNQFLNKQEIDFRSDIQSFARIMRIIIHFELGNQDLLEYTIRSTYRILYKRKRLYKIESLILHFIRKKMSKINTPQNLIAAFKELKHEFEKISKDPFEKETLVAYFDFISWLRSKIENRPYAEIIRENAKSYE